MITFSVTLSIPLFSFDTIANVIAIIEGNIGIAVFVKNHFHK